jgi:hypothetical protein
MTHHLTPEELVAGLDRTLPHSRARHVDECASCREALADLEVAASTARVAAPVPEPSPLFWDHLSERIRTATARTPVQGTSPWWRPLTALGAVAALVLILFVSRMAPGNGPSRVDLAPGAVGETSDEAAWQAMAEAASTLSSDDVRVAVALAPDAPLGVSDLTPKEREAFVRLLGREMGGLE